MAALKAELKAELMEELATGQWIDQTQTVIGRNTHVKACKRLIRKHSPDAYYEATGGRWLIRASALDKEISRQNKAMVESGRLPESILPPPMPPMPPVKAVLRDETPLPGEATPPDGSVEAFELEWFARLAGGK